MLSECRSQILILDSKIEKAEAVNNDLETSEKFVKKGLACIYFTSGSTGKPKGVMISQRAIVNYINDVLNRKIFDDPSDRVICVTTVSFDIFGFESIVPMCTGHSVYLANESEQLDPALICKRILEHKVTHILSTVSRIKAFSENKDFSDALKQLRCILSGGENHPISLIKRFAVSFRC